MCLLCFPVTSTTLWVARPKGKSTTPVYDALSKTWGGNQYVSMHRLPDGSLIDQVSFEKPQVKSKAIIALKSAGFVLTTREEYNKGEILD